VVEVAPAPPVGFRRHTLAAGETLSEVTMRYGISLTALVGANANLSSLDRLPVGVELLIPPGDGLLVTLEHGDTLHSLIALHGVNPAVVVRANGLRSPFDVRPGMLIFLPGVVPTAALERLAVVRELENTYIWPLHGRLTSYFGRRNLGMGTSAFHRGLDIAAPMGSTIVAARAGTVTFAGWSTQGYGNLVKIRHAGGDETWYAHASRLLVTVGQRVAQGERIALVGSTGISTGPHLHLELHIAGRAVDPLSELR
jgi:murein DD-endopeptidase MepM/ murein hydrolase activator NlpD